MTAAEVKTYDVNLFLLNSERSKIGLDELANKLEIATGELNDNNAKYGSLRGKYKDVEEQIEELERDIDIKKSKLSEGAVMKERLENQINLNKEKINSARTNKDHYNERKDAITITARSENPVNPI